MRMKLFFLILLTACGSHQLYAQPLFTCGSHKVSKEEFLRAYNKNRTPAADAEKAMRDYLDLYVNFKLKVLSAQDQKLDTLPQLKYDLENFRTQVQENFLYDEAMVERMQKEIFQRVRSDKHVWHFLVKAEDDTQKVMKAVNTIREKLLAGGKDYDLIINQAVATGVTARHRDLGFITVFSVPYGMENIIYSLKPGEVSKPYRSGSGWHLFRLMDERPSPGTWKMAQIMLALPPDGDLSRSEPIQKKADSIYSLLKGGADFSALARQFSEDKLTYQNGGEMAPFGTGKYDADFERVVFSLKRDGDISKPFKSSIGIHILKRISQTPLPADDNEPLFAYEMKQKLQQDARMNLAKDKLADDIKPGLAIKRNPAVTDADLKRYADSLMESPDAEESSFAFSNKTLLTYKNGNRKVSDWLRFVKLQNPDPSFSVSDMMPRYINFFALEHYKNNLESVNADFRYQMQEFREGNLLFEAMERNVWGKAPQDSAGLQAYYEANKSNYIWEESADMLIANATNELEADWGMTELSKGAAWRELVAENPELQIDSGRYEIAQIPVLASGRPAEGKFSEMFRNPDSTMGFVKVFRYYPANQPRNFEDARGLVINDYQNVLEKQWLTALRKKYPVKINEAVFKSLPK